MQICLPEVESTEDTNPYASASRCINFLSRHRIPKSLTRVLSCPDCRQARGTGLSRILPYAGIAADTSNGLIETNRIGSRLDRRNFAEEVVFGRRCERRVRICGTD